jgi:aryl-alcohol dehydrogenase-like predicted oxidoreductase
MFRLIDSGRFDHLLIGYGYFPKGMDTILSHVNLAWRERCLSRAHELGMGVAAMKVMASNVMGYSAPTLAPSFTPEKLDALRAAALRWVLNDERVTLAVIGVTHPEQIDQNLRTVTRDRTLTEADRALLAEFTATALESPIIQRLRIT